MIIWRRRRRQ